MDSAPQGLVVNGLVRRHETFVLGPLSLQLGRGRALGLLGANGAGKTTLLSALAGQSRVDEGTVTWRGRRIVRGEWRYRRSVSYVRDVPALYGELSVAQTVAFVARLHLTWQAERARALLELFRLSEGQRVATLSRGMRTKLGLLLGVSHEVELLLLDEVTAGVDADTRDEIQRFLRTLVQERGVSVVISSHIFDDIERVSDDVLILRDGQPVFLGALDKLAGQESGGPASLRDLYLAFRRP